MTPARILIVEDEAVLALGLQERLRRMGHEVVGVTARADEACVLADRLRPDLVLMDIRLEGKQDGIEAGTVIRARLDVPVIYLSAYSDDKTLQRARQSEAYCYLHKPVQDRELRSVVEMTLQRHASERRLRQSEQRYASLLTSIGDGVLAVNKEGLVTLINPVAEQVTGWRRDEALGLPIDVVFPLRDAITRQICEPFARMAILEDRVIASTHDAVLFSRDGREVPIEHTAAPIREKGGPVGAILTFRDPSSRREQEARLQRLQRLEGLGVMAGGIAHDFNNLLTPVIGYAGLLRLHLSEDSPGHAMLDQIEAAARRASEITRQVLIFSGETTPDSKSLELSALVDEVVGALRSSKYTRAGIQLQLAPSLPTIAGDTAQLRQVVFNLVTNAVESLGQGSREKSGHVMVRTGRRRLTADKLKANVTRQTLPEGEYVYVEIVDTGCGIEASFLEQIFEPFYTTKAEGRGLGLSAVLGILRGHRGALFVSSLPGRGSTFEAYFRLSASVSGLKAPDLSGAVQPRNITREAKKRSLALVVDDEEGILKLLGICVSTVGLDSLQARSGAAALDHLRQHPGEIAVVLIDLQMPGDDGPATIRKLRAMEPNLPVILLSGCDPDEALTRSQGLPLAGVMRKPFNLAQLGALIAKVVQGNPAGTVEEVRAQRVSAELAERVAHSPCSVVSR